MTLSKSDLSAIRNVVTEVTNPRFKKLEKGQTNLENGQKKIQKDLKTVIKTFDTEYLGLKRRVVKIENRLDIQPPEF